MNKTLIRNFMAACIAIAAVASCATKETTVANESEKLYFDSWLGIKYPQAKKIDGSLGVYYLPEQEVIGNGITVTDSCYAFIHYTIRDMDGNISESTRESVAKQLGTFVQGNYYGPIVQIIYPGVLYEGLLESIVGMNVGSQRTAIIPTWLMSTKQYNSEEKYLKKSTSVATAVYELEIMDMTTNIYEYQLEQIQEYSNKYLGGIDTTSYGFWYKSIDMPDETELPTDTTVYINYIGRLLDGTVFDTTIKDTAKVYGIYSSDGSYEPVQINLSSESSNVTMGSSSSSVVEGFAMTIQQMHAFEKGVGVFYSALGYDSQSSSSRIPAYAPLVFEIELVSEP